MESKVTNLFIGIFTTAWARLELYNLLDLMGKNVLYVDTDSCVYVSKSGDPQPALGDFLGDLTNEMEAYITQFVCGGPKNYGYKVSDGKTSLCSSPLPRTGEWTGTQAMVRRTVRQGGLL